MKIKNIFFPTNISMSLRNLLCKIFLYMYIYKINLRAVTVSLFENLSAQLRSNKELKDHIYIYIYIYIYSLSYLKLCTLAGGKNLEWNTEFDLTG